jgi:ATP-dependent RNA helicase DDX1
MSAFEEFGICPELITSCEENEWNIPTAVQAEAMPLILTGGDVLVASETGSGKTGAFGLPVLQIVHEVLVERAKNEVVRGNHDVAGAVTKQTANKQKKVTKTNNEGKNKIPRLSSTDRNALFAIDEETSNGLKAESRAKHSWAGARCTTGYCTSANNKKHTKVAYECSVLDDGLVRLGFSFVNASLDGLGTDASSWGYGGTGKKSHNKKFEDYGTKFGKGDVVTCMLNLETMEISYALNGKEFPKQSAVAFKLKKSSKAGDDVYFPAVCVKDAEVEMNFGSSPLKFPEVLKRNGFISCAECEEQNIKSFEEASQNNNSNASKGNGSTVSKKPLAIILEPVRDLAEQTQEVLISFKKYLINPEIECALFTGGGVDEKKQRKWLAEGCDIITGTPSKIVDHVEKGLIDVSNVKFFILDEADRLVSMGNQSAILKLAEQLQKFNGNEVGIDRLQTLMFSATLHSPEITRLATKLCVNPTWVDLKGRDAVIPDSVHHACVRIDPANHDENENISSLKEFVSTDGVHAFDSNSNDAKLKLSEAVKMLKPCVLKELIDTHSITKCMIFCRTNFDCDNLANFLNKCGFDKAANVQTSAYSCAVLGGAKSMDERRTNLSAFKSGEIKFLICTDVAARGLDISGLPFVINMTLPDRSEDYVHRIGRVGRADSMGLAISLVAANCEEKVWFCTKKGYKPWLNPTKNDVKSNKQGGHTTWLDESHALTEIERKLGNSTVESLGENYAIPDHFGSIEQYGKTKKITVTIDEEQIRRLEMYAPNVRALADLESQVSLSYWTLKRKFNQMT